MTVPVMKYCGGYINIIRYSKNSAGNAIYSLSENIKCKSYMREAPCRFLHLQNVREVLSTHI